MGAKGLADLLKEQILRAKTNILEHIFRHVKQQCGNVSLSDDVLLLSVARKA
jgi:hypothetical protein